MKLTDSACRRVIPEVMPKWFFVAQSQNKTAAGLRRKTHTARAEQVGMCFPAQINIWLTLRSGYYLPEISEWEVGVSPSFWFSSPYLSSVYAGTQVSLSVTKYLSDTRKLFDSFPDAWPKRAKGSRLNRYVNQLQQCQNLNKLLNEEKWTYLWSRRIGISKLWIWHGREIPQYPEIKRDWRSPLSRRLRLCLTVPIDW